MRFICCTSSIESALNQVIQLERRVTCLPLDKSVSIDFLNSARSISIATDGKVFSGQLTIPLIHQLGSRIWRHLDRKAILKLWARHIKSDLSVLLANSLSKSNDILRYSEIGGRFQIYGITSPKFRDMCQGVFRDILTNILRHRGITPKNEVFLTPFGEVAEGFCVPDQGGQVGLTCKVLYGLNNGYSSFRIIWGRQVLICSNGLTTFQTVGRDRWFHTNRLDITDFVTQSIDAASNHLSDVERQIQASRGRSAHSSVLGQFMKRLAVSKATKDRVQERLIHEFKDTGPNDWSVSQALTFLGQHENGIPFRVRDDLTRLGSVLLERSLEQLTLAPPAVTQSGYYDILR